MRVEGFIWLEEIVEKIVRKHSVSVDEAEEGTLSYSSFINWTGERFRSRRVT